MFEVASYALSEAGSSSSSQPLVSDVDGRLKVVSSVSGAITSTVATGPTPADTADDGSAPIQVAGIARQTVPTPVADGDVVKASFDDVGRPVTTPYQVRDLVVTAYVTVTSGTPTTLLAGDADHFLDLLEISCATDSTVAATNFLLTDDSTTVRGFDIPVSGTVELKFPVPLPQGAKNSTWRVDMEDVTGTTLQVGALFVKNK